MTNGVKTVILLLLMMLPLAPPGEASLWGISLVAKLSIPISMS